MPLYLVSAIVVELVALRVSTDRRPLAFGIASGVGIGTIGLASEWGWSQFAMPLAWPAELFPEGVLLGFAAAVAGGLLGAWIGARLSIEPRPREGGLRTAALCGALLVAVIVGYSLNKPADEGVTAAVALTEVRGGPERTVDATVTLNPRDAADDAEWLNVTAWQGDGLVISKLERVGPGRYRTEEPIPVYGNWKSLIRLHNGDSLTAVPVFLPEDEAIPAKEVPASARFERPFVADHEILQREQKGGSAVLTALAYGTVVAIALSLLALLAWGLHRLAAEPGGTASPARRRRSRSARPLRTVSGNA
jgi:hypothetical protein